MIGAALLGLAVGLPSRRLIGDYLAIVTLFFGEAFVEFTNNVAPCKLGGPNGITGIDPIRGFGIQLTTNDSYYYLLVIVLVVTMAVLRLLENSRTGRAWRAVREDPLAAAAMTIPVNRVKLSGVRVRRHGRGAGRHHLRRAAGERVPDRLRHPDPDPDLRRAHPRRHGQHRGRGDRRAGGDGHLRRRAAQPGRGQHPVLRTGPADPAGQAAPVAQAGRGPRRDHRARLRGVRHRRGHLAQRGRGRAADRPACSATGCATGSSSRAIRRPRRPPGTSGSCC